MPKYVVIFPADNEAEWEAGSAADHQATFDTDQEFIRRLAEHGGALAGGAALAHSRTARTLRRGPASSALVTEGPFAETVEQISGFFIVSCEEKEALVAAAKVLLRAHAVVEIRPVEDC
ncbi:MAG: YciI family protein [Ornithinibacter sp.]